MASTWSDLKIELIGTGDQSGTWGSTTNSNLGNDVLGAAIAGSADVAFSSADVTVTLTDTVAAQTARNLRLNLTGTTGGARNLILGSGCQIEKPYLINNGTADTITVKNTTGTGIAVPAGKSMWVYNNGTNVVDAVTHLTSLTLGSALPVASGGTGITSFGSGVATWLGTPSSANLASAMTDETGTGLLVFGTSPSLTTPKVITSINDTNGNELIGLTATGSAVNEITVANAATGNAPTISATGGDTDVGITLTPKGTGRTTVTQLTTTSPRVLTAINDTNGNELIGVTATGSAVNEITVANAATGNNPVISATGGDTNIGITLTPKGTGAVKLSGLSYPTADGTANQVIKTNGSGVLSFATVVTSPGGTDTQVQFNDSGSFGGDAGLTYNKTTDTLSVNGITVGRGAGAVSTNTAVGASALAANTTGANNTAVGASALAANTTGVNNTALGSGALDVNTTASNNTAVGLNALGGNITGSDNTAVGSTALRVSTGDYNTAIGSAALFTVTSGSNNTAVGYGVLYSNTASNNTAIGYQALNANNTGSGNVAIGVNSLLVNTTGSSNSAQGNGSLRFNTTGSNNAAFGTETLFSNTTGASNVAVGYQALYANTTASNNTAIGHAALTANTTGANNTAVGYQALTANTAGNENVAVGYQAFAANNAAGNSGSFGTAVGFQALKSATAGQNTAVGRMALQALTTGSSNTAVGVNANYSGTTGGSNVAMGDTALFTTTTGSNNTAIGGAALYNNSTASENTAVGFQALYSNTTGASNVAVGYRAGFLITTGTNKTVIGYSAAVGSVTGSHEIVIGSGITGQGADYFTFGSSGNLVYNQFTANATFTRSSDERLKTDIKNANIGLEFIKNVRPVSYKWKPSYEVPQELFMHYNEENQMDLDVVMHGFIAQNVKQALEATNSENCGVWVTERDGTQGVSREMFIVPLVKAVQELSAQVEALKAEIATLKGA